MVKLPVVIHRLTDGVIKVVQEEAEETERRIYLTIKRWTVGLHFMVIIEAQPSGLRHQLRLYKNGRYPLCRQYLLNLAMPSLSRTWMRPCMAKDLIVKINHQLVQLTRHQTHLQTKDLIDQELKVIKCQTHLAFSLIQHHHNPVGC